jgi:hypothetical protein
MQELTASIREQGQRRRIMVSLAAMCAHQPDLDRAGEVRCEDLYTSGALQAAAARPSSVAEPGRRARPHRNACRLHGLTGQWTHF